MNRKVTLVDLDLVEPFYTLRPIKSELISKGIDVIAWDTQETMGLGEAGSILRPEMKWALKRDGDIILDIGYGVQGAQTLNLIEGARECKELKVYAVLNVARPMTSTVEDIIEYLKGLGIIHGLINNSHLGNDTDIDIIEEGARMITEVSRQMEIPVVATAIDKKFAPKMGSRDSQGNTLWLLKRHMPNSFW